MERNVLFVVDVGNSRTKLARCERAGQELPVCVDFKAFDNASAKTLARQVLDFASASDSSVLAGSNGELRDELCSEWPDVLKEPLVLRSHSQIPITLQIETPETVGIDRLLNGLGAKTLQANGSIVVVDSGTATTVDLIRDGEFMGGAILPGLRLAAQSLYDYTAALPHIDTGVLEPERVHLPGRDTPSAIQAGVLFGQIGAIKEIVGRYRTATQDSGDAIRLLLTGGAAARLASAFPDATVCPYLSLRAMAALA